MSTPGSGYTKTATDPKLLTINGIGQTVISSLTIIGSVYLLVALWRQGRGKLRVRLLLGMIFGDLLLGLCAFVPNVWVLAGGRFKVATRGCDAFGFLYTSVLFSQHIYTLMIAIATFLLLKYPISPVTYWVERHSGLAFFVAWGLAFAHAGAWWAHAGFAPSGPVCYYAPRVVINGLDSRDLVQFIPRAFVFITIIVLYSMLYKFLRRPDTIQLSSQFVSGEVTPQTTKEGGRRKGPWFKWRTGTHDVQPVEHSASKIDPNAPWEQLEFVQIGGRSPFSQTQSGNYFSPTQSLNHHGALSSNPGSRPISPPAGATTPEPLLAPYHRPSIASVYSADTPVSATNTRRPSESLTLVSTPTPELRYQAPPPRSHPLSPVLSQTEAKSDRDIEFDLGPLTPARGDEDDTPSGQTLKEFFDGDAVPALDSQAERGASSGNASAPLMSATAYFNRQASLLMLYFPLAYMLVFSVSLIRLVYDMIHKDVNPALQIVSAWFVLSVGLIDAIVYGLAEFMVKRKVRRKMGDRL